MEKKQKVRAEEQLQLKPVPRHKSWAGGPGEMVMAI